MLLYEDSNPDHRQRLMATYQIDRQDDQVALQVAFAIVAAALTYILVVAAYLLDHCGKSGKCDAEAPAVLRYLSPAVTVAFVGFLVLNVSATRMRSVALQHLEKVLALKLSVSMDKMAPHLHTDYGLVYRPDYKKQGIKGEWVKHIYAAVTMIAYGAIYVILFGFTWLALYWGPRNCLKTTVIIGYAVIEAVLLAGLVVSLFNPLFKKN